MGVTRQDAINGALERLWDVGFTMEPGFAEHGTMVAETISMLGHDDAVAAWVEHDKTKRRHIAPPPPSTPIDLRDEPDWRVALGVFARATDWLEFFRRDLKERAWQETVRAWLPILLDGYAGGLTHGLIRTAHAVRSFPEGAAPSLLQLDELARGLAYWAATYQKVAASPDRHGGLSPGEALARLPRGQSTQAGRGSITVGSAVVQRTLVLGDLPDFASVVESVAAAPDIDLAISRHSALFARVLLAHSEIRPIPLIQLVHTITAPIALRNLLPYLPAARDAWVYACLWQVSASILARVAQPLAEGAETAPEIAAPRLSQEDLAARVVAHRDDHVIKLTEALLREDRLRPDPVYRAAAEAVLTRIPAWT